MQDARPLNFTLLNESSTCNGRRGRLHTQHGVVETPVFMPVGTQAAIKSLDARDIDALAAQIMLSNAYHLLLRPGSELVAEMGGLHRFMGYHGAILTDSGGYQVFSLAARRQVTDHGVVFRSHIDGSVVNLTPEKLVHTQEDLAPDIAMVLDECPPAKAPREVVEAAIRRTTAWAERCLAARQKPCVGWFGIVQGALFTDLRAAHAATLSAMPFDGLAIGGVSVGEETAEIKRIVDFTARLLPRHKPRYLMGVGTPEDLVRGVAAGVDMFDCVMPSRNARNGQLFTSTGKLSIKNAAWRRSGLPLDANCSCYTCQNFSRAYLRHLFVAKELTYHRLATIHNIAFYLALMADIRWHLQRDSFVPQSFLERVACGGIATPEAAPSREGAGIELASV